MPVINVYVSNLSNTLYMIEIEDRGKSVNEHKYVCCKARKTMHICYSPHFCNCSLGIYTSNYI